MGRQPRAELIRSSYAKVDLKRILGIGAFAPPSMVAQDAALADAHGEPGHVCDDHCAAHDAHGDELDRDGMIAAHRHDPSIDSVSFRFERGFDMARLRAWLETLAERDGEKLFRFKGILAIHGDPRRHVLQGVHRLVDLHSADGWGARVPASKVVFIGRDLDRGALHAELAACLAP